jgi:hypothetical protein
MDSQWECPTGAVRVTDFMPPRAQLPCIVRVVEGLRHTPRLSPLLPLGSEGRSRAGVTGGQVPAPAVCRRPFLRPEYRRRVHGGEETAVTVAVLIAVAPQRGGTVRARCRRAVPTCSRHSRSQRRRDRGGDPGTVRRQLTPGGRGRGGGVASHRGREGKVPPSPLHDSSHRHDRKIGRNALPCGFRAVTCV